MNGARVQNIDALKHFRAALVKFTEAGKVALGDAESEVQRTVGWLQSELQQFWQFSLAHQSQQCLKHS